MGVSNHEATGGPSISPPRIEPDRALSRPSPGHCAFRKRGKTIAMKIASLALLGLLLGALGGATLGIGAEFAWVEIFKTTSFEGYSGMLVFFTFMPLGAMIGVRAVGLSGQRNRDRTRARPAPGPVNILNRPS